MSNFDQVVTQWIAPSYRAAGRAWICSHVQVTGLSTSPSTVKVQSSVLIDGVDLKKSSEKARGRLAYVPDECPVYPFMTGGEFLRFVASTKRVKLDDSANEFIAAFGLREHLDARFDEMSLGTKKKMMLCACWIGAPKALLLDEPSNGLDLASREYLIQRLQQAAREKTILFSAHDADFVLEIGAVTIEMTSLVGPTHLARNWGH